MLEEVTYIDRKEILKDGQIQVREKTAILKDGVEISSIYHRYVLKPDTDISTVDAELVDLCNLVWTDEIKANYEDFKNLNTSP